MSDFELIEYYAEFTGQNSMPYPTPEQETVALDKACPFLPEDIRTSMIQVANDVRTAFLAGQIDVPLSTRVLIYWAKYASFFKGLAGNGIDPISYAFDRVLGNKASAETRESLLEILQRTFEPEPVI